MDNDILNGLNTAKAERQLLAVYRDGLAQSTDYTGFPVLVGRSLLLLAREVDFALDGYVAMRLEDVSFLEQVDDNAFIRRLITGEKLYDRLKTPPLAGADNWKAILDCIKASFGGWLSVESYDGGESSFIMGNISRLDPNFLYMRQVSADGTRHQEETTVPLQDITTITFGGRYIDLYKKYCGAAG